MLTRYHLIGTQSCRIGKILRRLKNKANNTGDKLSPCLTPQKLEKSEDCSPLYETHDFIPLYMFNIIWKHFNTLILLAKSFFHSPTHHTESNVLLKTINEKNNFFFWDFAISANACKTKI